MTALVEQFPFIERDPGLGQASLAPMLSIQLAGSHTIDAEGLVDSGATINVLPFGRGQLLGFDWDSATQTVQLSGNLAAVEARVIVVQAAIGRLAPVRLAFAWAKTDHIPMILGQVNFFLEFDVCFFRSRKLFEVRPKHNH